MKARELQLCEIQQWYPLFKTISLKTIIHPLPESFITYLQEDGLFLARNSEALPARAQNNCEDEDYRHWDEEDNEADEPDPPSFPELEGEVAASIAKLDGSVFPKLNWSAPKDSAWISSHGNLKCTNFGEICLLLKASDSLVHDLSHAFDSCEDKTADRPHQFVLALRKWYDIRPEMEFRGFVKHGLLVGVSQREVTGFYPALLESQETLDASIFQFFIDCISETFELDDYTFDCYVTRAGKVKLVDFNPWGAFTLPLLFTWDELEDTYARLEGVSVASTDADGTPSSGSCNGGDMSTSSGVASTLEARTGQEDQGRSACCLDLKGSAQVVRTFTDSGKNGVYNRDIDGVMNSIDNVAKAVNESIKRVASSAERDVADHCEHAPDTEGRANPRVGNMLPTDGKPASSNLSKRPLPIISRKRANIALREHGFKSEFRIVQSNCHVQVNLRVGGGVPYDYVQTGPGSAWDEFLRRAGEELQQQNKDAAAGG